MSGNMGKKQRKKQQNRKDVRGKGENWGRKEGDIQDLDRRKTLKSGCQKADIREKRG